MKECAKRGCDEPTTDRYCSHSCKTAADHAQAANRRRVIDNYANMRNAEL